jgi:hypothetical protein
LEGCDAANVPGLSSNASGGQTYNGELDKASNKTEISPAGGGGFVKHTPQAPTSEAAMPLTMHGT